MNKSDLQRKVVYLITVTLLMFACPFGFADLDARIMAEVYSWGETNYIYDDNDRLIKIVEYEFDDGDISSTYITEFDHRGNEIHCFYVLANGETEEDFSADYTYDGHGVELSCITHGWDENRYEYSNQYDSYGRLISSVKRVAGTWERVGAHEYTYDDQGRLTSEKEELYGDHTDTFYNYDIDGKRYIAYQMECYYWDDEISSSCLRMFDSSGRPTIDEYMYYESGSSEPVETEMTVYSYEYDSYGNPVLCTMMNSDGYFEETSMEYNANGKLLLETYYIGEANKSSPAYQNKYVYDSSDRLIEYYYFPWDYFEGIDRSYEKTEYVYNEGNKTAVATQYYYSRNYEFSGDEFVDLGGYEIQKVGETYYDLTKPAGLGQ